jgi:glycosyltransferase involved in cell wall biosynthesis
VTGEGGYLGTRVWITWENQRRSIELAKKLGCKLFVVQYNGIARYPRAILKTISILTENKPEILFVQNPSMVLATLACIYGFFKKIPLVVDRHTTFLLNKKRRNTPRLIMFKLLHRFTIRFADLTIVTNDFLANLIRQLKGKPFVLPDMIPKLMQTGTTQLKGRHNILLISSFGPDEPIKEVIEAMKHVDNKEDVYLYITGNYKKLGESTYKAAPSNVVFTGFLDEQEFINILFSVDAVIVLTTADYTMLCGCYEAVSARKPLITSDKDVLREYFKGAIFADNSAKDISNAISEVISNIDLHRERISNLKERLVSEWEERFVKLEDQLVTLGH